MRRQSDNRGMSRIKRIGAVHAYMLDGSARRGWKSCLAREFGVSYSQISQDIKIINYNNSICSWEESLNSTRCDRNTPERQLLIEEAVSAGKVRRFGPVAAEEHGEVERKHYYHKIHHRR